MSKPSAESLKIKKLSLAETRRSQRKIKFVVTIEPISEVHLDWVHQYASDKRISDSSNVPYPYTREMADSWFKIISNRQKTGLSRVFSIIYDGAFAGVISLNNIFPEEKKAEIDYWVAVKFQGKGVATAAVAKLIDHAKQALGIKTFYSGGLAKNTPSLAVQRKNGFTIVEKKRLSDGKFSGEDYVISKLEL
jgi:[ribosomal protein S5]-alanine N-acetyltransferase